MFIKVLFILNFIISCSVTTIFATCRIRLPADVSKRPDIFKVLGTRQVKMISKAAGINIPDGGKITIQCNTSFVQ